MAGNILASDKPRTWLFAVFWTILGHGCFLDNGLAADMAVSLANGLAADMDVSWLTGLAADMAVSWPTD